MTDQHAKAPPSLDRKRSVWLLVFCCAWALANLVTVTVTGERDLLALGVIPIMLTGWLFTARAVLFTTAFLYVANAVYMTRFFAGGQEPDEFVRGLVAYAFFLGIGAFVAKVRSMSNRIKALNRELVEKNRELAELSLRDHLTGLYNRRYVNDVVYQLAANFLARLTLPEAQKRAPDVGNTVIAVFMVDIDGFKAINDSHGHAAGDRALVEVAARLRQAVRFDDIVVRWGGEEFLVVCPGVRKGMVGLIVDKLFAEIRRAPCPVSDEQSLPVTISVGCSHFPLFERRVDAFSFEEAIGIADAALYLAKEGGRDRANYACPRDDQPTPRIERGGTPYRELIKDGSLFVIESLAGPAGA